MPTQCLVTGFGPFGGIRSNPSAILAVQLEWARPEAVKALALPSDYQKATQMLLAALEELRPQTVLMLGYSKRARGLKLETTARNRCTGNTPDESGVVGPSVIIPDGPPSLPATLSMDELAEALSQAGMPHHISTSAGGFVCNYVFYQVAHALKGKTRAPKFGFIHVNGLRYEDKNLQGGLELCVDSLVA